MPTNGGSPVVVLGSNLGLTAGAVTVTYTGGPDRNRSYSMGACTVVSPGTKIQCPSAPGAGANYSVVVSIEGRASQPSDVRISYAAPVISSMDGDGATGATTEGGSEINLRGSNFGPEGSAVQAWAIPAANTSLTFSGLSCVVVTAHVAIRCITSPGIGTSLAWRVMVDGQANSVPESSYASPRVDSVTFAGLGVTSASTVGGTDVLIQGANFGALIDNVEVAIVTPSEAAAASMCTLQVPHRALRCTLPAGTGAITRVTVTVLGQSGAVATTGLAYAPPEIYAVSPAFWPTNVTAVVVTLTGRGFGSPVHAAGVTVVAMGRHSCGGEDTAVVGSKVVVRSDSELSFVIQGGVEHVVTSWSVGVSVAGQGADVAVGTKPPGVPTLTMLENLNGALYSLQLTGSDYGAGLSGCASDVSVRIDGQACVSLTMTQPHSQLLCVTSLSSGIVTLTTSAGSVTAVYDARLLVLAPTVTAVAPAVWSSAGYTTVNVAGDRWVDGVCTTSRGCMGVVPCALVPSCPCACFWSRFGLAPAAGPDGGVVIPMSLVAGSVNASSGPLAQGCSANLTMRCVVVTDGGLRFSNTLVSCVVPPGVGTGWHM
jgi:hypothetical protein